MLNVNKHKLKDIISSDNAIPLEITGLSKKYSQKSDYAVSDISFNANEGDIIGILGANGAGKSTILKCITGMIPFLEGEIKICGRSIKDDPIEAKRNFSFVTDNHSVFVKMTGMQYICFMADIFGVDKSKRAEIIKELDSAFYLGDSIYNLISTYSHGMKQKICMMGSLVHSPKLWVLDEPMVGLDPRTQSAVTQFMLDYAKRGNTILFSSHNITAVERVCDRAVVIDNGKMKADIVVKDLLAGGGSLSDYSFNGEKC